MQDVRDITDIRLVIYRGPGVVEPKTLKVLEGDGTRNGERPRGLIEFCLES